MNKFEEAVSMIDERTGNANDENVFEKEKQKADKPKTRDVYLPEGANWADYWTGKNYEGGKSYTFDAPIDKIPILVKQGSILPLGPEIQYADGLLHRKSRIGYKGVLYTSCRRKTDPI